MPDRLEVQRAVAAPAGEIFAVLTDPQGHVAIDSSGMLMAASGERPVKAGDTGGTGERAAGHARHPRPHRRPGQAPARMIARPAE